MDDAPGPLLVGYGNSLREDDGVGWHAAAALAVDPRFARCTVRQEFQLLPELAADVAMAGRVVLIDARAAYDVPPGTLSWRTVAPEPRGTGFSSHHVTPEALLALTLQLYGAAPPTVLVEVATRHFGEGVASLTAPVAAALPAVADLVARVLSDPTRRTPEPTL